MVQTWEAYVLNQSIQAYDSPTAGTGLVVTEFIPAGTVIWRLSPDAIKLTASELRRLPKERQMLAYQCGDGFILADDGSEYTNHSCDPNTWWLNDETMTASRDIQPGEEISYDYASSEVPPWRAHWQCHCQSEQCRGIITGRDCLDPAFQERHRGHLPSWVVEFIEGKSGRRGWCMRWLAELFDVILRMKRGLVSSLQKGKGGP